MPIILGHAKGDIYFGAITLLSADDAVASIRKAAWAGMQFFKIGVDAWAAGMRKAYLAEAEGRDAMYWNSAFRWNIMIF